MDRFTFTNTQIIGFFIPGFVFIMVLLLGYTNWSLTNCFDFLSTYNSLSLGLLVLITSMFFGLLIDAIRNGILEDIFDKRFKHCYLNYWKERENNAHTHGKYESNDGELNWDFFNDAHKEKITKLYAKYYIYYIFDINAAMALLFSYLISISFWGDFNITGLLFLVIVLVILCRDMWSLRKEVYFHTNIIEKTGV